VANARLIDGVDIMASAALRHHPDDYREQPEHHERRNTPAIAAMALAGERR